MFASLFSKFLKFLIVSVDALSINAHNFLSQTNGLNNLHDFSIIISILSVLKMEKCKQIFLWQRSLCILKLLSQILLSLSFPVACILIYVNSCFYNRSLVDIKFVFLNIKSNVNLHFNPEYGYKLAALYLLG